MGREDERVKLQATITPKMGANATEFSNELSVLKEYDSYISGPIETYGCPYPKHTPFPHRPCWKGYVRVNKTQLKKHSGKLQFHPLVCHTLPASLAILDFSPMGQWHQPPSPVISDMPTTMIMCQYRSNLCFSLMCPLSLSCCVISLRHKVDGLGNQSSQMRRHIL